MSVGGRALAHFARHGQSTPILSAGAGGRLGHAGVAVKVLTAAIALIALSSRFAAHLVQPSVENVVGTLTGRSGVARPIFG